MVKIIGILLSAAPHIERLQKPASFFQILLELLRQVADQATAVDQVI
jgi:hypothetical protein